MIHRLEQSRQGMSKCQYKRPSVQSIETLRCIGLHSSTCECSLLTISMPVCYVFLRVKQASSFGIFAFLLGGTFVTFRFKTSVQSKCMPCMKRDSQTAQKAINECCEKVGLRRNSADMVRYTYHNHSQHAAFIV